MADDDLLGSLEDVSSGDSGDMASEDSAGEMGLESQQDGDLERVTDNKNLDMILDIPLIVTVELGRTKIKKK